MPEDMLRARRTNAAGTLRALFGAKPKHTTSRYCNLPPPVVSNKKALALKEYLTFQGGSIHITRILSPSSNAPRPKKRRAKLTFSDDSPVPGTSSSTTVSIIWP